MFLYPNLYQILLLTKLSVCNYPNPIIAYLELYSFFQSMLGDCVLIFVVQRILLSLNGLLLFDSAVFFSVHLFMFGQGTLRTKWSINFGVFGQDKLGSAAGIIYEMQRSSSLHSGCCLD